MMEEPISVISNKLTKIDFAKNTERYNQYMKHVKELNFNDFIPPEEISHTESPFKWIQAIKPENLSSSDYLVKMDDYANQGDDYCFEKFIPFLALAFEYSMLADFETAKYYVAKLEHLLTTMQSENGGFYTRIKPALDHVFLATKTNIFTLMNDRSGEVDALKEKCSKLMSLTEMDSIQKAAIYALKSKFYLSCTYENELALDNMMEAVKLDPKCATWVYWTGKILRKMRRDEKIKNPTIEITYFEDAVNLDEKRKAKHLVFLAQAYREKAVYLFQNKGFPESAKDDIYREIDSMNKLACDLYLESVDLNQNSAAICRRAGNGLMSLPKQFAKYTLAKSLLHKAEKLSKNPVTYHILGTYYLKYEENLEKAVEYFKKTADCNMVYGHHELIKIKYVNDSNYDPLEDLLTAAKSLEFSSNIHVIEGDLGWYYTIFQNNLAKGLEYYWKVIERDENSNYMKKFYSYSFVVKGPLNMFQVLKDKILKVEEEMRDKLMIRFLEKVNNNPQLLDDGGGECVSLEKALRESKTTLKWEQSKQQKQKNKLNQRDHAVNGYENRRNQNLKAERATNWRQEFNLSGSPKNDNLSMSRNAPKQENWRLECRKF